MPENPLPAQQIARMEDHPDERAPRRAAASRRRMLFIVALLAGAALAVWYYWQRRAYETTDNAFIEGAIIQISPRVFGQVLRVHVEDNQHVNRGDLLVELDPADYEARLTEARARLQDILARAEGARAGLSATTTTTSAALVQARAGLEAARAQVEMLRARLDEAEAAVRAAEANLAQARARRAAAEAEAKRAAADFERYRALFAKDEISRQMLDRAETEARAAAANLDAATQLVAAAEADLARAKALQGSTQAALRQAETAVQQAEGKVREAQAGQDQVRARQSEVQALTASIELQRALVRQAELNLSYTQIRAPEAGYITKKSVEPGNIVQPGQALMALVCDRLWVVANFKETQLRRMRPGQPAEIRIDAYPQLRLRGRVDSIQSGSGARFSLLPPENATGNYVKVVQRVPVKIVFTDPLPSQYKLGPGMSVVPRVRVR
ncbi:MAG: HlyD family secretion protein [Bryobacterales bacterium]|nr:HlyD family secretion protein [Bryobacteraceae bacterium]MDW8129714.1 HlyD family secretion protein [Bryobacterales bacterium]